MWAERSVLTEWRNKGMGFRRIISGIAAFSAAAATIGAASVCALADETPAGYVYFMADKSTIGQGFVAQPAKIAFYEGETGLDVVKRAAEVLTEDGGYGAYITAFADNGEEEVQLPAAVAEVVAELSGRTAEGYLSAMDYTAESGWSYFINDEYAQVGISDYAPADGDVMCFEFTVYGYGADLGIDNSSWGGAAALKPTLSKAELIRLCAEGSDAAVDEDTYNSAMEVLADYESSQEDIDNAAELLSAALNAGAETAEVGGTADTADTAGTAEPEVSGDVMSPAEADEKGSPATGVEGVAVAFAVVILAGAGIALCKKQ